jgi:hypothetical protein
MDIVDIYGHIDDGSELVIGVGNYNNIHGLMTYSHRAAATNLGSILHDDIDMRTLPEIHTPSVVELVVNYEKPMTTITNNKLYFTLKVKDSENYISVKIETDGERRIAVACISREKTYFWIDYSIIDRTPRSKLLSGSLYSLRTIFGEQEYVVSWKINGFSHGDLIIFIPISWYEATSESQCQNKTGLINLVESLNQLKFKGFTTKEWCESAPNIINCSEGKICGDCIGQCQDLNHICYPNPDIGGSKFICGIQSIETMNQSSMITLSESPPSTTGTVPTWIAIISIVVIVSLLTWGLSRRVVTRS